jgi:hypothetical protein
MKKLIFPGVPKKFKDPQMPAGFVNDVRGWSFSRLEVEEAATGGKLLTLDINMAGRGACSRGCEHCFLRTKEFINGEHIDLAELTKQLSEAKALGLRTVKLIGPGEPLEDKGLLPFLRMLREMDIVPLIFTKGLILGNDEVCAKIHGMDGHQLAEELKRLGAVSLLSG